MMESASTSYEDIKDWNWEQFQPLVDKLLSTDVAPDSVEDWLGDWTQLVRLFYEISNRAFVATTIDTTDEAAQSAFSIAMKVLQPQFSRVQNLLNQKLVESGLIPPGMEIPIRRLKNGIELFREENLPLLSAEQNLSTEYNRVIGAQSVEWEGEQLTLRQLQPVLSEQDRERRERAWRLSFERSLQDRDELNDIWTRFLDLRAEIGANAGMADYRAYKWKELNRFDYTPADALSFFAAIEEVVVPAYSRILEKRRQALGLDSLRPWDTQNDVQGSFTFTPLQRSRNLESEIGRHLWRGG